MTQTRQGSWCTKPNTHNKEALPDRTSHPPAIKLRGLYVVIEPISKLYMYDMGCFLIRSHSGNHCIMLAYHVDTNFILVNAFHSRHNCHRLSAYNHIMSRLKSDSQAVDLQVLDNKAIEVYKLAIEDKWN